MEFKELKAIIRTDIDFTGHVSAGFPEKIDQLFSVELEDFYSELGSHTFKPSEFQLLTQCLDGVHIGNLVHGIFRHDIVPINVIFELNKFEKNGKHELTLMVMFRS